ncbi:MAG: rRNA pseudouridine synthase, partial [Firmicutes bacterium]|nr:rRNA pseudouridine synthase [Bacillota bacterium]
MRINKYLASSGIASRRNCEQLVLDGKVRLNGRPVTKLATEVKDSDIVTVDGKKIAPAERLVYLMLNKPKGYICSTVDEKGRKTVMELIKDFEGTREGARIFPVGRLDFDTEGLLLFTNDGDFAQRLTHPKNDVDKTYHAKIEGEVTEDELNKLRGGIVLDGEKT